MNRNAATDVRNILCITYSGAIATPTHTASSCSRATDTNTCMCLGCKATIALPNGRAMG